MERNGQLKILSIDYGDKRIGLAKSGPLSMAWPVGTYLSKGMKNDIDYFSRLINDENYNLVVIGLPLNMDGSEGERVVKTKKFASILQKVANVDIEYVDERLTTVEAHHILDELGIGYNKHEKMVDTVSAQIILQSFLDKKICHN